MKFTIDAGSDLARAIIGRKDMDMTLSIMAHGPTFSDMEKLVTARLMSWTVRKGCDRSSCAHCADVMDVEWLDSTKFLEMCTLPPDAVDDAQ